MTSEYKQHQQGKGGEKDEVWRAFWDEQYHLSSLEDNHNLLNQHLTIFMSRSKGKGRPSQPREVVLLNTKNGSFFQLPKEGDIKNGLDDFVTSLYDGVLLPGEDPIEKLYSDIEKIRKNL